MGIHEYILDLKNPNELRILVEKTFKFDMTICQVSNLSHHMNKMVEFSRGFEQEAWSLLVNLETCEARGLFTLPTQEGGREFYEFNPFQNGSIRKVVPN